MEIIQASIPVFLVLILVEAVYSFRQKRGFYRLHDSIINLSTGLLFSVTGAAVAAGAIFVFSMVQDAFSFSGSLSSLLFPRANFMDAEWPSRLHIVTGWLLALLLVDFFYYWFHRLCHEVNFLWACHVTHHSSEEFNLTVAIRQSSFQRVFEYTFNLPLALLGMSWEMFFICHGVLKLYQFWVHTRAIGSLGFLENIFLTPSHHRVHHGRDSQYLDRNHGGILILWDRWFGTYSRETSEPQYGLTRQLHSFNPAWATVHSYLDIFRDLRRRRGFRNRLYTLIKSPGWKPEDEMKSPKKENSLRFDVPASSGVNALFIFRFAFFTLLSLAFLKLFRSAIFDPWFLSSFALSLCAGISALGADLVPSRAGLVSDVLCFLSGAAAAALTLKFHPQLSLYLVIYCALVVFLSLARQIMHTRSAAA